MIFCIDHLHTGGSISKRERDVSPERDCSSSDSIAGLPFNVKLQAPPTL
jgi:hypothetical protein